MRKVLILFYFHHQNIKDIINNNSKGKLKRRDQIFEQLDSNQKIHNWNYEKKYENADSLFYNEDHLNIKGSKIMSIELDFKLRNLLKIKARK